MHNHTNVMKVDIGLSITFCNTITQIGPLNFFNFIDMVTFLLSQQCGLFLHTQKALNLLVGLDPITSFMIQTLISQPQVILYPCLFLFFNSHAYTHASSDRILELSYHFIKGSILYLVLEPSWPHSVLLPIQAELILQQSYCQPG